MSDQVHAPILSGATAARLVAAIVRRRPVGHGEDIVRHGETPGVLHMLLDGHAGRYRMLGEGRRQITALVVPGDLCDLEAVMRGRTDHAVVALTPCTLGEIPRQGIRDLIAVDPDFAETLWRRTLRDEAIAQEWIVGLGRRTALERVAHLLCELHVRLRAVGLAREDGYALHMTQAEIADALGLSGVHVNRTLQELRRRTLIALHGTALTIPDRAGLEALARFDPAYLGA